ncbi:MAG TPA: glycoside hydrolase family 3 C-terminal domain-containing protein [Acidobacteriaceae bacterium]|nr:glycoside hydrolase family 3 C-terminal domain-containing protein [Acidobacteriaceae bacterium]
MLKLLFTSALALSLAPSLRAQQYPFRDTSLAPQKRIDNLLSLMTLDEKIDCLSTNTAVPRLGVPSFGSSEGIHGVVQRGGRGRDAITTTQFPQPPGLGETWDPALVEQAAAVEGHEARYITQTPKYNRSILMLWGPQADLARDPRWGRSEEVYGEDPFFNGTMVTAFVHGLQGDDPHYWQAASLMKHFLANSNEDHRDRSSSDFDTRLFWEYYSVPFRMGFEDGGARGVMASYNSWNGTPMAVNPILKSIVIDQWHALVLSSDGGAVKQLWSAHHAFPDQKSAVIACLHAGINQFLDTYKDETHAAIKEGSVTEAELDTLLRRKFEVTLKLGLLDPPNLVPYTSIKQTPNQPEPWNSDLDKSISLKAAIESIVLLKNANNTLPLDKSKLKSIAVIGPLADSVHWDWYGGTPPYAITPLAGIKAALGPDVKINYAASELGQQAITAAKNSDVAIVVVGNDPTCGPDMARDWHQTVDGGGTLPCTVPSDGREGRDRESLTLEQEQLVKQVFAVQPRTIMLLISSFPYTINWSQQYIPAILHMAHSSQDEGTALARVLFGDANPGGHLVVSWPRSIDQLPPMMDYDIRHGRTYMYFKGEPLYPFGFGLSYTTFRLSNLKSGTTSPAPTAGGRSLPGGVVDAGVPDGRSLPGGVVDIGVPNGRSLPGDAILNISVDVTNTGTRAGDEVVQLYVHHLHSAVARPAEELKGFQRISLAPGETRTVIIPLKISTLAYWNDRLSRFLVEKEPVELRVGDSSRNILLTTRIQIH